MKFEEIVAFGNSDLLEHMGSLCKESGKLDEAIKYFEAAYNLGNNKAAYELGCMYDSGNPSLQQDTQKALEYYEYAKEHGNLDAINVLGRNYYNSKEYELAYQYFREGYVLQLKLPTNNLGLLYENGFGVEKDLVKACKYYIKSYELGYNEAIHSIKRIDIISLINYFKQQIHKYHAVIDSKDIQISEFNSQITELKLRPPELGGPEYEAAKTNFEVNASL